MASREEYAKRMHEKMNATYYEWVTNTPVEIADNVIDRLKSLGKRRPRKATLRERIQETLEETPELTTSLQDRDQDEDQLP